MYTLLKKHLRQQISKPESILSPIIFFILVCFIFSLSQPDEIRNNFTNSLSVMLCSIILAYCIAITYIFEEDFSSGMLQLYYLNCDNKSDIVIAKIISTFVLNGLAFAFIFPVTSLFFRIDSSIYQHIFIAILCISILLSLISVMIASLIIGLKNGGIMASIISLPLFLPVIITSISFFEGLIAGERSLTIFLQNVSALFLIYAPLAILSGTYCIKIATEE
ncbi:MAG TPA: hypothetical protein DIV86_03840 [Alphaproteobacteria bacterium]|nr:hypothetical protein [Alphaproteobacteria bacterium]